MQYIYTQRHTHQQQQSKTQCALAMHYLLRCTRKGTWHERRGSQLLRENSSFLPCTTHFVIMREIHGSAKFVAAGHDLITQHQTKRNGNYERKFHSSPPPPISHLLHIHQGPLLAPHSGTFLYTLCVGKGPRMGGYSRHKDLTSQIPKCPEHLM